MLAQQRALLFRGSVEGRRRREATPEIDQHGPDRAGHSNGSRLLCRRQGAGELFEQHAQVQLGRIEEGQKERRLALVCLDELHLVERGIRQRQPARGAPLQCPRPVQEDPMRPEKVGHLDLFQQRKRRRVVSDKSIEILIDEECRPGLGRRAVTGVGKITSLEAAARCFPGVLDATLEGTAPEVDVGLKLLVDFRAPLEVVEPSVDLQGQGAPFVRRSIVSSDWSDHDGVGDVAVGAVSCVAVRDRQAYHRGGNQTRKDLVAGNVRRSPENREDSHDHPHVWVGHLGQIDQRGDGARTHELLHRVDFAVERCELVVGSFGKRNLKQGEAVAPR